MTTPPSTGTDLVGRMERAAGAAFAEWLRERGAKMPDRGGRADLVWYADSPGSLTSTPGVRCQICDHPEHIPALIEKWLEVLADAGIEWVQRADDRGTAEVRGELVLRHLSIPVKVWGVYDTVAFEEGSRIVRDARARDVTMRTRRYVR